MERRRPRLETGPSTTLLTKARSQAREQSVRAQFYRENVPIISSRIRFIGASPADDLVHETISECGRDGVKGGGQVGADEFDGSDDYNRDQGGDESVLDSRCAAVIRKKKSSCLKNINSPCCGTRKE